MGFEKKDVWDGTEVVSGTNPTLCGSEAIYFWIRLVYSSINFSAA